MTNGNIFPSATASFLPLPTPSSNRQILSPIENNLPSTVTENDLQRVPHSWMFLSSTTPTYGMMNFDVFIYDEDQFKFL